MVLGWLFGTSEAEIQRRNDKREYFHKLGDDRAVESDYLRKEQRKFRHGVYAREKFWGHVKWEAKMVLGFHLWKYNQPKYQYTFHHTKTNSFQSMLDIIEKQH